MKLARFMASGRVGIGRVEDDTLLELEGDDILRAGPATGRRLALDSVRLLAPVQPSKVLAVGWNYVGHAAELEELQPADPLVFLKAPSAVIGPGEPIVRPGFSSKLSYEGELAAVIGRRCTNLAEDEALGAIFGWTCGNDVTDRDIQKAEVQYARSKSFDTFCPLGPWVETDFDFRMAIIETRVNGALVQAGTTELMIHKIPKLLAWASRAITFEPGDVILTGTPKGVGLIEPGDLVEVTIPGIGTLTNSVVTERRLEPTRR